MALIEKLTKTHADLDQVMSRFRTLLANVVDEDDAESAIAALKQELDAINHTLDLHIETEQALEKRSDEVLGEGSMQDYGVGAHHANLRESVRELARQLSDDGDFAEIERHFDTFLDHFKHYTKSEWEFLQANSTVLFPGGSSDG